VLPVQESCRSLELPKKTPSLSAMLDSADLMQRLGTLDPVATADLTVSVMPDDPSRAFPVDVASPTARTILH